MYRLLIVEDDRGIAQAIREQAEMWGLEVRCVRNFRNVTAEFAEFDPHIVLLDIALPFYNGFHWCSEIRKVSKVPIIFISSASDNMNIVMAMNMGGDDFIAKPFDRSVLMAKLQAMLRRTYDFAPSVPVLEHRGALLNTGDNTLTYEGEKIPLSKNEYRILLILMESRARLSAGSGLWSSFGKATALLTKTLCRLMSIACVKSFLRQGLKILLLQNSAWAI